MNITRRAALLAGLTTPLLGMFGKRAAFAATSAKLPNPVVVAVSGIDTSSDLVRIATLMAPFLIREVPITLTVVPFDGSGLPLEEEAALPRFLRESVRNHPEEVEIGIHAEKIESGDPYFQLRQMSMAQAALSKFINEYENYEFRSILTGLTVTTNSPLRSLQDAAAMRAAGIRTVIRLPSGLEDPAELQPADGGYWETKTGLVNTFGAPKSSARPAPGSDHPTALSTLADNIRGLTATDHPIILDIPFAAFGDMSDSNLASYATQLAQAVHHMEIAGMVRTILPRTLYKQSAAAQSRFVVVRVDDLRASPIWDVAQMAFIYDLIEAGYPVTEAIIPSPLGRLFSKDERSQAFVKAMLTEKRYDLATHGWEHKPSELVGKPFSQNLALIQNGISEVFRSSGRLPVSYIPPNNAYDDHALEALAATGTPLLSAERGNFRWFSGLDSRGLLHVSNSIMFEQAWTDGNPYFETSRVLDFFGTHNDAVFTIHPATADTPQKRQGIRDVLETLSSQPGTRLVNFDEYRRAVLPTMPGPDLIRSARADVVIRDWQPGNTFTVEEEKELRKDAALAWRYFDWGGKKFNGMVPATCWMQDGQLEGYPFTTMWDVASYILAAVSAHRLEIIDQPAFEKTVGRILAFLGESNFRYAGAALPHAERPLATDKDHREGFDSADTGRLLIALRILDSYTGNTLAIDKLVSGWDFWAILKDGEMHVISASGRAKSAHSNSYAGYVSRGYGFWGYPIKPVFETEHPDRNMDDAVLALAEIRRRGRIATEPHITEEIELGGSPHGRLMSDILYAAQMQRYQETGILTCVSETPVPGAPYFTYQGYQLDENGGKFMVDASTAEKAAEAAARGDELRLISSKGAYLWYAARPGSYSTQLISMVREQARMPDVGFASGISERTGKRVGLSDINTNGVILEAIAFMLGGRKPFLSPDNTSAI